MNPRLCHLANGLELSLWPLPMPLRPLKKQSVKPLPCELPWGPASVTQPGAGQQAVLLTLPDKAASCPDQLLSHQWEVSGSQAKLSVKLGELLLVPRGSWPKTAPRDASTASQGVYSCNNGHKKKKSKKTNSLESDPISLCPTNINAVQSGISKPIKLVKPVLTTRCRQTIARPAQTHRTRTDNEWCKVSRLHMAGCIWSSPQLGVPISTLLDHLVASRCKDWAAARMGWLTGWLDGINSSSGS